MLLNIFWWFVASLSFKGKLSYTAGCQTDSFRMKQVCLSLLPKKKTGQSTMNGHYTLKQTQDLHQTAHSDTLYSPLLLIIFPFFSFSSFFLEVQTWSCWPLCYFSTTTAEKPDHIVQQMDQKGI